MDKVTAIDEVITAVVAALDAAVEYLVFDGPPSEYPPRDSPSEDKWVSIGAESVDSQESATDSARMDQVWYGLGKLTREETLAISCVAIGKADSIANARTVAMAIIKDVGTYLPEKPTSETYGALVSSVSAVRSHNVTGGAIVQVLFTISASARLT